jgi:hypothetical protein
VSEFTTPLKVMPVEGGRLWELLEPFVYYTDEVPVEYAIRVPAGFITDFASVPRLLWWLLPPWGQYGKAAVVHDFLYQLKPWSRKRCDEIFLEGMCVLGVSWQTRTTMYTAVRMFGWLAWRRESVKQRTAMFVPALIRKRVRIL